EALARELRNSRDKLAKYPSSTKIWFKDGQPLEVDVLLVNKDLPRPLRAIASQDAEPFYRGDIAKNTAAFMKANGGLITEADLAAAQALGDSAGATTYCGI